MTSNPSELPSQVEETLSECPQFRILLTGNTGIGKSSLVSRIFNVDPHELDIAHDRAGRANIEHGFTSPTNPRFILHDSEGYEPGSTNQWGAAEAFIRSRVRHERPQERVHAIWLCIETPRTGGRLLQSADENLIELALKVELPLLVVFTKYDLLISEKLKEDDMQNAGSSQARSFSERLRIATSKAQQDFQRRVQNLPRHPRIKYITVSTNDKIYGTCLESFQNLTKVTREMLRHVEGELWVPWATAQQVNALQKVEISISEGFKKYWLDLGTNVVFEGFLMWDCISRIHRDILEIWNFNDPNKVLTGDTFCTQMVQLTQPILMSEDQNQSGEQSSPSFLSDLSNAVTIVGSLATGFAQALSVAGIATVTIKFLYRRYQRIPITSLYLASYITSLIIILQSLFIQTLAQDPPRPLTKDLVIFACQAYVDNDAERIFNMVKEATRDGIIENPEMKVAAIIKDFFNIVPDKGPVQDISSTTNPCKSLPCSPANTKITSLEGLDHTANTSMGENTDSQTLSSTTLSLQETSQQGQKRRKKKISNFFSSVFKK